MKKEGLSFRAQIFFSIRRRYAARGASPALRARRYAPVPTCRSHFLDAVVLCLVLLPGGTPATRRASGWVVSAAGLRPAALRAHPCYAIFASMEDDAAAAREQKAMEDEAAQMAQMAAQMATKAKAKMLTEARAAQV